MSGAIGIFGGTFDPVHFGHLRAATEARELLGINDFRLLLSGTPPHRSATMATSLDRLAMLKLAVSDDSGFQVDDREVQRQGLSYMVDTLTEIRAESGNAPLLLIIGQDAANELDSWHNWLGLFDLAHVVIMRRPDTQPAWSGELRSQMEHRWLDDPLQLGETSSGAVCPLLVTQLAISSTDIRRRMREGRSPRFLMPDSVIGYILQKQLYFAGQAGKG